VAQAYPADRPLNLLSNNKLLVSADAAKHGDKLPYGTI
jgi:hypothetical protein